MVLMHALVVAALACLGPAAKPPAYSIHAIRYATIPQFFMASLIPGSPAEQRVDIAMAVWLIRGGDRVILFDSGFHRENWRQQFKVTDFLRPTQRWPPPASIPQA